MCAAADRLNEVYDATALKQHVTVDGLVSRLPEGISQGDGGDESEEDEDASDWLDLGPERPGERDVAISKKLAEAIKAGI